MAEKSVVVVVTTYEPGPATAALLGALTDAGQRPIVVDDGSVHPPAVGAEVEFVVLPENRGIASALNAGLRAARARGATHVITLDQDSMVGPDFAAQMSAAWSQADEHGLQPAVVAPGGVAGITYRGPAHGPLLTVPEVMQSGAMFGLDHLRAIGDFDESLVIDGVDTDACLRLRKAGWDVVVAPVQFQHQLGRARAWRLGSRTILLTRHAPFRDYYMARNRVLLVRAHLRDEPRWAFGMARRTTVAFLLTAVFDQGRWTKLAAMLRGLRDGLRGRRGPLPASLRQRWNGVAARDQAQLR